MGNSLGNTMDNLRPPVNYFWHWADKGNVIEWQAGDTICYREDLMAVLKKLSPDGLPAIGSVLLIMSACRVNLNTPDYRKTTMNPISLLLDFCIKYNSYLGDAKEMTDPAFRFLQIVRALPPEMRSGDNRVWLLYIIFSKVEKRLSAKDADSMISFFNAGHVDHFVFRERSDSDAAFMVKVFKDDMRWLQLALEMYPTANELELAVRTGNQEMLNAAELELPKLETGDLLEQLEEDASTTGLAQLTKRLIAALNIPMHAHGSSDQLFGGVSDITNRGNFDRLLLSELAHDDLSLMARLANNEALYLRREELPSNPEKLRILLIDTTLKMWGLPRVFAVSAALACAHNNKAKAHIASYALSGTGFNEIDLTTKEGVVHSLEQLDATLHCGRGLSQFMSQQAMQEEDEVFLITEEEITHSVLFQSILASLKKPVNFLVTVNRSGELRFYEYSKGRKKQLSEARFDLQELLFHTTAPKREKSIRKARTLLNAPAFMQHLPSPLFLPASKIKFNADCFFEVKKDHLICITIDQRVLYWDNKTRGAREIIEHLEFGQICFGSDGDATLYILVYSGGQQYVRLYEVNLESNTIEITKLREAVSGEAEMVFDEGYFYIKAENELCAIEAATGKVYPGKDRIGVFSLMQQRSKKAFANINLNFYKKFVNDGYTTINTVKSVYMNADGELGFDDRYISFRAHSEATGEMIIIDHNRQEKNKKARICNAIDREMPAIGLPNTNLKFSRFVWADGSELLADSRGLLHLKSADSTIPEITIVMIMGRPTACWAADGRTCGSPYFTGKAEERMVVAGFYHSYIKRYIDRITKHATNADI